MEVDKEETSPPDVIDKEDNPNDEEPEMPTPPLIPDQSETDTKDPDLNHKSMTRSCPNEHDDAENSTTEQSIKKAEDSTASSSVLENIPEDPVPANEADGLLLPCSSEQQQQEEEDDSKKSIKLNAEFESFLELKDALERYQREKCVQLIVKDSKLLSAGSTKRVIPKVYHLVNPSLMYHSITYCCKCHGELKLKPNTRVKNVGAKRLGCPMYLRLRLTSDLQRLVLFELNEQHNHGIDPTTCQMAPRQQVYALSRLRQGKISWDQIKGGKQGHAIAGGDAAMPSTRDVGSLIQMAIKDVSSVSTPVYEPPRKVSKTAVKEEPASAEEAEVEEEVSHTSNNRPDSPLDSESSFSDSDDEEAITQRRLLPFPIRLIGSAVRSSPELINATRELIELKKATVELERQKLLLQTRNLELNNLKLELEVKKMEQSLRAEAAETDHGQDTTIYLQAA